MPGRNCFFCSSLAYSSKTGPSIQMPNDISGGRAFKRASSCASTRASALASPPPPYSLGQVGAVQPLADMRSSQSCSGFLNLALRPPQIELSSSSSTAALPRIEGGQLASSQLRVSLRKVSRSLIVITQRGIAKIEL